MSLFRDCDYDLIIPLEPLTGHSSDITITGHVWAGVHAAAQSLLRDTGYNGGHKSRPGPLGGAGGPSAGSVSSSAETQERGGGAQEILGL